MLDLKIAELKPNKNKAFPPRKTNDKRYNTHKTKKPKKEDLVLEDLDNEDKKENLKEEIKNHNRKKITRKSHKQRQSTLAELVTEKIYVNMMIIEKKIIKRTFHRKKGSLPK
jgi:hypothetical protein